MITLKTIEKIFDFYISRHSLFFVNYFLEHIFLTCNFYRVHYMGYTLIESCESRTHVMHSGKNMW